MLFTGFVIVDTYAMLKNNNCSLVRHATQLSLIL